MESDENMVRQQTPPARDNSQTLAGWVRTHLNISFSGEPAQDIDEFIDNMETSRHLLPNRVN